LKNIIIITVLVLLLFVPFTGKIALFDWDEANFAEISREMIVRGDWSEMTVNYEPFHEKPPLFFWVQAVSMKTFGINEFSARFPNILMAILTLSLLFLAGKKLKGNSFGWLWVLCFGGSFLPQFYFRFGIIDPLFNLLNFISVLFIFYALYDEKGKVYKWAISGLAAGLSVMTKGPAGLLLIVLPVMVYLLFQRKYKKIKIYQPFFWLAACILPSAIWFLFSHDEGLFLKDFLQRNIELLTNADAGHGGFFLYHWLVVFAGMFPLSILVFYSFRQKKEKDSDFSLLMKILLLTVLIVFTLVRTKIVHYSSLAYLPLSWLVAESMENIRHSKSVLPVFLSVTAKIFAVLAGLMMMSAIILLKFRSQLIDWTDDIFIRECLLAEADWNNQILITTIVLAVIFVATIWLWINKPFSMKLFYLNLAVVLLISQWFWIVLLPQVQKHTQGAVVEFSKSVSGNEPYIITMGHKSYLPYFYGKVKEDKDFKGKNKYEVLLTPVRKKLYIISKSDKAAEIAEMYNLEEVYRKNGWVFMIRKFDISE